MILDLYACSISFQEAMKKAEAAGNDDCPVKIKLVAPPLYVLTTQTLDKVGGRLLYLVSFLALLFSLILFFFISFLQFLDFYLGCSCLEFGSYLLRCLWSKKVRERLVRENGRWW